MNNDYNKKQLANEVSELIIDDSARHLIRIDRFDPKTVAQVAEKAFGSFAPSDVCKRILERVKEIKKLDSS